MEPLQVEQVQEHKNGMQDIEGVILAALLMRHTGAGQRIDISQLQEDCLRVGYSPRELSQGLVSLLRRSYLSPCGEMTFMLTRDGHQAGEQFLLATRIA